MEQNTLNLLEQLSKLFLNICISLNTRLWSCDNNNILLSTYFLPVEPKEFSHKPLYSISSHRITDFSTRNNSNSGTGLPVFRAENGKALRVYAPYPLLSGKEIRPLEKPKLLWQTVLFHSDLTTSQATSLLRPLALLLLSTFLPLLLLIRIKKPWVLFLLTLLG